MACRTFLSRKVVARSGESGDDERWSDSSLRASQYEAAGSRCSMLDIGNLKVNGLGCSSHLSPSPCIIRMTEPLHVLKPTTTTLRVPCSKPPYQVYLHSKFQVFSYHITSNNTKSFDLFGWPSSRKPIVSQTTILKLEFSWVRILTGSNSVPERFLS